MRMAGVAKSVAARHRGKLNELKAEAKELERPDWVWHCLLVSFSTMGNSRGYDGLIKNKDNYSKVTFDSLARLAKKNRKSTLKEALHAAKVRMPDRKATWLFQNFDRISKIGGPVRAKQLLLSRPGPKAKMKFLESFKGIGPKYARNMMMDVYHPDFHESIAIDQRILSVSKELGLSFRNYGEHEQFYLDAAHDAALEGWELDRLVYWFKNEFLDGLCMERVGGS